MTASHERFKRASVIGGLTTTHAPPRAVGGPLLTPMMKLLLALMAVAGVLLLARYALGLGPVTNLNDGYPWGLWITFDVVTGTALGCGGYAMALMIYVFNRGQYHSLIRAAILTSALGYTLGSIGVLIDVGRVWWTWKLPIFFWTWNLSSIQLEVALCIMIYTGVLWIEFAPTVLERWQQGGREDLKRIADTWTPRLHKAMPWLIALGVLLPTMHQSGLGSMILLAGPKLHPLWNTSWLPFLFLSSCIAIGYGMTVLETMWSRTIYRLPRETTVLMALRGVMAVVLLIWIGVRLGNVIGTGKVDLILRFDLYAILFWVELALFAVPLVMLAAKPGEASRGWLFLASGMMVTGGAFHRFCAYWFAFQPGRHWNYYYPSLIELVITLGLVAAEAVAFMYLIKRFPILTGRRRTAAQPA